MIKDIKSFVKKEQERLSKTNLSNKDFRVTFRYFSYDSQSTINLLKKMKPIDDKLNGEYQNGFVQCFDIGKRKIIKRYICSIEGFRVYKENEINTMLYWLKK